MASKNNSGKKTTYNTQNKRKEAEKQKRAAEKQKRAVQDEIILIIALVVSILMFLSYFDLSGIVGEFISGFLFGMIGLEAYILPIILFFGTAFHISNYDNREAERKLLSAVVFLVILTALIQLITVPYVKEMKLHTYYLDSSDNRTGGGIIGGILVMLLCGAFDVTATYIILIAAMIICIIVITGKAIFLYIAKKSKKSMEERIQNNKLKKEEMEEEWSKDGTDRPKRRRFKTFLLDEEDDEASNVINLKEKRSKRKRKAETNDNDLPLVNLDPLTPEEVSDYQRSSDINIQGLDVERIPTYEDEINDKFGKTSTTPVDNDISEVDDFSQVDTTAVERDAARNQSATDSNKSQGKITSKDIEDLNISQTVEEKEYVFPSIKLLTPPKQKPGKAQITEKHLKETAAKLQNTLESFGVHVTITNVSCGPSVTRYELQPEQGVKVKSITSLADDIKLNLAAAEVRIEAPIPGKSAVGIEVPNKDNFVVTLREMLESKDFANHPSEIAFAVGRDIGGQVIFADIGKMPHLLIAGATGSGKSVCINTLIMSLLYKSKPSDVRMIMIDPKVVELNAYNGIPHLLIPVVTDPKKAAAALNWAVIEMTDRYKRFAEAGVRDLQGYNEKIREEAYLNDENYQKLPQIVIIIDELADLMMVAPGEVEDAICRLAQMARAAGLHLIIATQRPSVNVITGVIKANIPSRIAFAVSSAIDSRTIIDGSGAEKLLGKGDMLFFPSGYPKPVRIQGTYVSDKEVGAVVDAIIKNNSEASYSEKIKETIENVHAQESLASANNERDDYFVEAGRFIIEKDKASIGMLQRVYRIGFNRAARIMDQLAEVGVVGPEEGTKPRKILMSEEEYEQFLIDNGLS